MCMLSQLQACVYPVRLQVDQCEQGQQQTVMFCGDGLNDLAALGTAEVGLAIGPINAMAAAPFSTRHSSIAGEHLYFLLSPCSEW